MRGLLAVALALLPAVPTDYTVCTKINNGPITPTKPALPFQRMPDLASLTTSPATGYGTIYSHDMPPLRYRGDAVATVHFVAHDELTRICADGVPPAPAGKEYTGCVKPDGTMWVMNPCGISGQDYALTVCHEIGHLNGWAGNHPL